MATATKLSHCLRIISPKCHGLYTAFYLKHLRHYTSVRCSGTSVNSHLWQNFRKCNQSFDLLNWRPLLLGSVARAFSPGQKTENKTAETRPDDNTDDQGILVRLNNENGYLSWCRNAYLATTAGAIIFTQEGLVPHASEISTLLVFIGGLNLLHGTAMYMYYLAGLRRQRRMGLASLVYQLLFSTTHLVLWLSAMAIYIGYVEEEYTEYHADTEIPSALYKSPAPER